jgi:hypothetical protein
MTIPLLVRLTIWAVILFSFLQAKKLVVIKNSQVRREWVINVVFYYLVFEFLGSLAGLDGVREIIYLLLFAVPVAINLTKFSLGYIQNKEISWFNRFEHMAGGLIVFMAIYILKPIEMLPMTVTALWLEVFFYLLLTNLLSVLHEIVELFLDRVLGKKYLIGPGVEDTNIDLLMTLSGAVIGFLAIIFLSYL